VPFGDDTFKCPAFFLKISFFNAILPKYTLWKIILENNLFVELVFSNFTRFLTSFNWNLSLVDTSSTNRLFSSIILKQCFFFAIYF
jgi:hypothetical protein